MDSGTTAAVIAVLGSVLTMFGAGNLVPAVGPAVQGLLAIITLAAGIWSWYSHRQKTATIAAGVQAMQAAKTQ